MEITQKTLNNGLNTLFINSPGSTSGSVQIWFRAGSALEKKEDHGIAHFLEHMFFKGTPKRPGAQIAHEVESFGGEINAFTSFDYTCYYINTPTNKLQQTTEILLDMVSNPMFAEEDFPAEREVVFEEYRRSLDNPNQYNFFQIQKNSFTANYGHPILGNEPNIKNFNREQLINFRKNYYNIENALLVVSGNIPSQENLEKQIEDFKIPSGKRSDFPHFNLKKSTQFNVHTKDVNQVTLTMTIQAPDYNGQDGAIEDVALNCLAYGEISPLYKRLVTETSYASSVSGSTMFFAKGGVHFLRMTFPLENFSKAINEFTKTIQNVLKNGFKENDILRIKNQYIASKVYEKESIESYSFSLGHGFAQTGDIHCEEEFIKKIKSTTSQSALKSLQEVFNKPIHYTVQLPKSADKAKAKALLEQLNSKLSKVASKTKVKESKYKIQNSKFDPEVKVLEIKKGVKLIYRENDMTPTFVLHAYMKGGLAHENPLNNGSYNFLAKLLTHGYDKISFEKLKGDLERKSAYLNGFTGKNAYGLTLHGLSEHFTDLAKHFHGTLLRPSLPNNYLKVEKELIKRLLEVQKEDPVKQCFTMVNNTVFHNHPYSMDITGTEKSIRKISRKSLADLHNERLKNSEMVFTYCGSDSLDFVLKQLEPIFQVLSARTKASKKNKNKIQPLFGKQLFKHFDREQSHIFLGRPSFKVGTTEDLYLKMLNAYLSGQSSELFVDVRDRKGLCYAVQPLHHTALEAGYWGIYIGAGHDKSDKAIDAIMGILEKLRVHGLSKKEFNRIKTMIDGQNLLNIQTNDDYANFYSIPILHHLGIDYQHISFEKIRNFSHDEFNRFLQKFLKTDWNLIKVGPQKAD